jgi:hypothetical protein
MSRHHSPMTNIFLFVSVLAIALAAQEVDRTDISIPRKPASIVSSKDQILGQVRPSAHNHTAKIRPPVQLSLAAVGAGPAKIGDVFVLRATITSDDPISNLRFKWRLPQNIEHINGVLESMIESISSSQPATIEITLKTLTAENQQVFIQISAEQSGLGFGDIAQYNTNPKAANSSTQEGIALKIQTNDGPGEGKSATPNADRKVLQ